MNYNKLEQKAFSLGASNFGISERVNTRFFVIYHNTYIHFGSTNGNTYIDHHDNEKRKNWIARHSRIKNINGEYLINIKESLSFWSKNLLW